MYLVKHNIKVRVEEPMRKLFFVLCLLIALTALMAEQVVVSQYPNDIRLTSSSPNNMELEFTLGSFYSDAVNINGSQWYQISMKKEGLTLEAGLPQLPVLARSVIIPATAAMQLQVLGSEYVELPMPVAPSKGNLTRDIDPDSVPYSFADFYNGTGSYPESTAYLTEPFIIRDYRGITVRFQPFVYFPATGTLRIYTKLNLALVANGTDMTNALTSPKSSYTRYFEDIYQNMFLNFADAKYPTLGEEGRILVVKHSMFDNDIIPWVNWKKQLGFTVDVVDISVAGPTATQLKAYIQAQYDLNNGLMFVQLFGDGPQIPIMSGGSDPMLALLAGGDSYPDIYVGRFSASNSAEAQTQVQRTIHYERDIAVGADWVQKAFGIASNEGGGSQGDMGESDQTHQENIRTDLLNYGYTSVDQIYQTQGASATMVTNNINAGRGFGNYTGHGSATTWVTTGFSVTNVNALANSNMLPFIVSVACVNGNFVSQTCFAEAWLRSTHDTTGEPTGAVAFWGSTINQGWNPPMRAQDEVTDLLVANAKHRIGSLYFNGASKMIEVYGASGISEYKCWTIFGDASLMVRTKNPQAITATYNPVIFLGMSTFAIQTVPNARITLTNNGDLYGTAIADAAGNATINFDPIPVNPMDMILTIAAFDYQTYIQTLQVLPSNGPYIVLDQVQYSDGNDGLFQYGETIQMNLDLANIGSEVASGLSIAVSSADPYVTVLTPAISLPDLVAGGETPSGTFSIQLDADIPDQHEVAMVITINTTNGDQQVYNSSFLGAAPNISWGSLQVNDTEGNNNGMVEAGEIITFTIPIINDGHFQADNISSTMMVNGVSTLITPIVDSVTSIPVNQEASLIYNVTFSSQIPMGTPVQITVMTFYGSFSSAHTYTVVVGLVMDGFENGFVNFPWAFMGGTWSIEGNSYNGSNAARSAAIAHSTATSISVNYTTAQAGEISFWKKVSSEQNYDFLKFYINGILKNQWSGTSDQWEQATYPVQPGMNVFKWEYTKDSGTVAGSDCAWIDDVVFPSSGEQVGAPAMLVDMQAIDFGIVHFNETESIPVTVSNAGTAAMLGTITSAEPFWLGTDPTQPVYTLDYQLQAGEFITINVNFSPTVQQEYSGDLIITSDDPFAPVTTIPITGTGAPVANEDPVNPVITALKGNHPNPFNPSTTISFSLKEKGPLTLEIYNILGQKVTTLVNGVMDKGTHNVVWNGKDSKGRSVASGIFFYRMKSGAYTSTKKMIMMK